MKTIKRILLVEDDGVDRHAFVRALRKARPSVEVTAVPDLEQAAALLLGQAFDAAVLDYRLPEGTGLDLVPALDGRPFVVVTGQGSEEAAARALRAGASDYILKDIAGRYPLEVAEALERALGRAPPGRAPPPAGGRPAAAAAREPSRAPDARRRDRILQVTDRLALIAVADARGRLVHVNALVCRASGWAEADLLGRDFRVLQSDAAARRILREPSARVRRGTPWQGEIRARVRDGSSRWMDALAVPFLDGGGQVEEIVFAGAEITSARRAQRDLQERLDRPEEGARHRARALGVLERELRPPLGALSSAASLLATARDPVDHRALAGSIDASIRSLTALLGTLAGREAAALPEAEGAVIRFHPREVLQGMVALFAAAASEKGLSILCACDAPADLALRGDPSRLGLVLLHLMGDAVRTGGAGLLELEAKVAPTAGGGACLRLRLQGRQGTVEGPGHAAAQRIVELVGGRFSAVRTGEACEVVVEIDYRPAG